MRPERVARLVARWVRLYTSHLPPGVAARRVEEVAADVHDHVAHERTGGVGERRIALALASRLLRGVPADALWRGGQLGHPLRGVAANTAKALSIPAAMQLAGAWRWGPGDFLSLALVWVAGNVVVELGSRRNPGPEYRGALLAAVATATIIVLGSAAVGLVGEPGNPANAMYAAVLLVLAVGAVRVRLRPAGMTRVLLATAAVQAVVGVAAAFLDTSPSPVGAILGNACFAVLFAVSAALFHRSAAAPR